MYNFLHNIFRPTTVVVSVGECDGFACDAILVGMIEGVLAPLNFV